MSTRLIQIVNFPLVAPAAVVALPHNINIDGVAKRPDFVAGDASGFTIVVTDTTVTVTNNNVGASPINVWLELKHTIPRQLGALPNLTPQPFVASGGSPGGGGLASVAHDLTLFGDGTIPNPLTSRTARIARFQNEFASSEKDVFTDISGAGSVDQSGSDGGFTTVGILFMAVGTVIGNATAARLTNLQPAFFGQANTRFFYESRLTYSGATADMADMALSIGLDQEPSNAPPSNGYYFAAGGEFGLAGNNWYTCLNGLGSAIDTGVAVQGGGVNGFQVFRVEAESTALGAVTARFYIDDVLVATRNPVGVYRPLCCVQAGRIVRGNLAGAKSIWNDYVDCVIEIDRTIGT